MLRALSSLAVTAAFVIAITCVDVAPRLGASAFRQGFRMRAAERRSEEILGGMRLNEEGLAAQRVASPKRSVTQDSKFKTQTKTTRAVNV
jgi:hypothetical protein